jgi:hypothetical protein
VASKAEAPEGSRIDDLGKQAGDGLGTSQSPAGVAASSGVKANNARPDPRHAPAMKVLAEEYELWNEVPMPTPSRVAGALKRFLESNPRWTSELIHGAIQNRFRSEINRADEPWVWLPSLSRYVNGPLDRFNRPKRVTNPGPARQSQTGLTADQIRSWIEHVAKQATKAGFGTVADGLGRLDMGGKFEEIELALQTLDSQMADAAVQNCPPEIIDRIKVELDTKLNSYRKRFTRDKFSDLKQQSIRKAVREHYGLPHLSLFYCQ